MVKGFTVDGYYIVVILDSEGKVVTVVFPTVASDTAGNPFFVSFGYGMFIENLQIWLQQLVPILNLPKG